MRHSLWIATITLSALAACGGGEGGNEAETGAAPTAEPAQTAGATTARAQLADASGQQVGTATLTETDGGVQVEVQVNGLPPGPHGVHVHQTGTCTAPDFASAGPHFNPTQAQHGLQNPQGPHAGDMENLEVGQDGNGTLQFTAPLLVLSAGANSLMDADGAAIVVHAGPDDHVTDPSGNSGDRIACGAVQVQ